MSNVDKLVIEYNVSDAAIALIAEEFKDSDATNIDGYAHVVKGIRVTRELRSRIESRRKELKADALAYGRRVDGEARRITDSLVRIEGPLKMKKATVDLEKARVKREAEEARLEEERRKLEQERAEKEEKLRKEREAEEAQLQANRERLEAEQKAFEEKQIAERKKIEVEEYDRRQRILVEEAELQAKRDETARLEAARVAADNARKEADQKMRDFAEHKAQLAEAEKRRVAALPDVDKLRVYTDTLLNLPQPDMVSPSGNAVKGQIDRKLLEAQKLVADFALELEE